METATYTVRRTVPFITAASLPAGLVLAVVLVTLPVIPGKDELNRTGLDGGSVSWFRPR